MSRKRNARPGTAHVQSNAPFSFELVLVDQEPLRCAAAADCSEVMGRLERARAGWRRFEHQDKPAFARWRAREFGPLLSEARDVEAAIRDQQALIHEVEMEMRRGFLDAHTAWQRVMTRRGMPHAVVEPEPAAYAPSAANGAPRRVSEFEQEAMFHDWVQRSLGTNPDKMDDEAYSTTFEAFKAHMFRPRTEEAPRVNPVPPRAQAHVAPEAEEEAEDAPIDLRVKELYRMLVRRLHPDMRADGSAAVSALWHEVQEAYAAGDVAQLELLLAVSDIRRDPMNDETSLAQMRSLVADLERALRAVEKSLEEAEREDAWDFAHSGANEHLHARVERELKAELARRSARRDLLAHTIAEWARGPAGMRAAMRVAERQFAW
jgi:hypothetical protein